MSHFLVEKLTKTVGDKTVFQDISFIIHDFDRIGIIGVNGTGDSDIMMTDTINPLKSKFKASTKLLNKTI
ncbi:TPA: hypothetical protein ACF43D_000085 [Streptococcus pyogenes]